MESCKVAIENQKVCNFLCMSCYACDKETHDLSSQSRAIDFHPSQSVNNVIALKAVQLKEGGYVLRNKLAGIRPNGTFHSGRGYNVLFRETVFVAIWTFFKKPKGGCVCFSFKFHSLHPEKHFKCLR